MAHKRMVVVIFLGGFDLEFLVSLDDLIRWILLILTMAAVTMFQKP
jgi:hypothetical protein